MARANGLSPGHGRPVQLRFETELTAEEYVSREEWRNTTFPPCLKDLCRRDCGTMRHGTYGRKTPVPLRVARFDCRECQATFSRLPDFAAARRLFPHRDELSNAIRGLCGAFAAVSAFLAAVNSSRATPSLL